ncbi:FAD:protein FMN transferase [Telluribacter sp. SYSU D00476]|uniref:FAD:protein FMN transferase n=1 Tax=Telluribacter sp. SYSU D00476 TaxID=2811430 RepID=UPI001FF2150E|nr:FAD:protein FMN transferase [Telluribacter sp. SYSU D00476]
MRLKFICVCIVWAGWLAGCQSTRKSYTHLEGQAQGTTFRIVYNDSLARDFSQSVDSIFRVIDRSMSLWDSTSVISGLNANRSYVRADAHFTTVFRRSQEVAADTKGYFDPTVGPLVKAWGFSYKKGLPQPDRVRVDSLLRLVGYQKVRLEGGQLVKETPAMEIDFNAIAQGYTVDVIAGFLKSRGVRNYLVEIGGEVRAEGQNERSEAWHIGIDKPVDNQEAGRPLQTVVPLSGRALATSGSYRKFVERDGRRYSHAIDPHTGVPITHNLLSISVIADDCMTADAYATAFLVMGLDKALPIAKAHRMELYGIYEGEDGALQVYSTPGFGQKE